MLCVCQHAFLSVADRHSFKSASLPAVYSSFITADEGCNCGTGFCSNIKLPSKSYQAWNFNHKI